MTYSTFEPSYINLVANLIYDRNATNVIHNTTCLVKISPPTKIASQRRFVTKAGKLINLILHRLFVHLIQTGYCVFLSSFINLFYTNLNGKRNKEIHADGTYFNQRLCSTNFLLSLILKNGHSFFSIISFFWSKCKAGRQITALDELCALSCYMQALHQQQLCTFRVTKTRPAYLIISRHSTNNNNICVKYYKMRNIEPLQEKSQPHTYTQNTLFSNTQRGTFYIEVNIIIIIIIYVC